MTADELPDFVTQTYPDLDLQCIAVFERDSIAIQCEGEEVAAFTEDALEEGEVTDQMVKDKIETWRKKKKK